MSILHDYEKFREKIGEEKYRQLETYMEFHPDVVLSDLLYNKEAWDDCMKWIEETPDYIKENEPVYLVIQNYKGICEHNFLGTKEEIPAHEARANVTYDIHICRSEGDLIRFLAGSFNDVERMREDEDWYYNFDRVLCGQRGLEIANLYADKSEQKILKKLMKNQGFYDGGRELTVGEGPRKVGFEILESIGTLEEYDTGWKKELNLISWNGLQPKYDIREWSPDHTQMTRGITLTLKQMETLCESMVKREKTRSETPEPSRESEFER